MARVVRLNEGQLRKLVRGMLNEAMGAELQGDNGVTPLSLQGKHKKVISMLSTVALWRGAKTLEDVRGDLDSIVAAAEKRLGYEPALVSALDDLVTGDYGDLAILIRAEASKQKSQSYTPPRSTGRSGDADPASERSYRSGHWEDPLRHPQSSM
jgi:hypothetical protein